VRRELPADDHPAVGVDHEAEEHQPLPAPQIREVREPHLIRPRGLDVALHPVWAAQRRGVGLQDLVRAAQLGDLTSQGFDLLALLAGQNVFAPAIISFRLPDVFAERLSLDAKVPRDMRDRTPGLEHQTRPAVQQLL
jgi:hypothetical protein